MRADRSGLTEVTLPPGVRSDRIEPLWRRVERNRLRFIGLMLAYVVVVALSISAFIMAMVLIVPLFARAWEAAAVVWVQAGEIAWKVFAVVASVVTVHMLVRLARSERALLETLEAHMPKPEEVRGVREALKDMALAAGLEQPPRLYLIETDRVNAAIVGRRVDRAAVVVTRGFIEKLERADQRAVFANLLARALSGDMLWATALSALVGPIWAMRDASFSAREPALLDGAAEAERRTNATARAARELGPMFVSWILLYGFVVVVTELLTYWHQDAAWRAAEKADAEGMLLLKDPHEMLAALERVLSYDNCVPTAREAYSQLFYCWAGFGFAPEEDPEFRRVARLREVLGVEGLVARPQPNVPGWPVAPRLEYADHAPLPPPVATPVEEGVDGVVLLIATVVISALAIDAVWFARAEVFRALRGPALAVAAVGIALGVGFASRFIAAKRSGPREAHMAALVAFAVFTMLTLGRSALLSPVWFIAMFVGADRGAEDARRAWRASLACSIETRAQSMHAPSVGAEGPAARARERITVTCRWCGASNAPVNERCVVCGRRLKP